MKGKGADLFFDGLDPAAATTPAETGTADAFAPVDNLPHSHDGSVVTLDQDSGQISVDADRRPAPRPRRQREPQPASSPASTVASRLATIPASESLPPSVVGVDATIIEAIRKIVKHPGREVSFVRLSPEEKGKLADIVYTYKRQGVKTTENEINRIAVNFLLADYYATGEESILAQVIVALRA